MSDKIYWLNKDSRKFLERGYLLEGETPEQRIQDIGDRAQALLDDMPGFSDKFVDYMSRGFYSLASPIWSNFGRSRGLPISCFGSYIPDDMNGILSKVGEIGTMSKVGGGTSAYFGDVRGRGAPISSGGAATGVHHQLTVFDSLINYVSQGNVPRRRRHRARHVRSRAGQLYSHRRRPEDGHRAAAALRHRATTLKSAGRP